MRTIDLVFLRSGGLACLVEVQEPNKTARTAQERPPGFTLEPYAASFFSALATARPAIATQMRDNQAKRFPFPANGMATEEAFEPPRHPGSWWISGLRSRFLTGVRTNLVCAARHALSSRDEARRAKGRAIQKDAVRLPPRRDRALIENVFGRVKCPARPTLCDRCGVKRGLSPASHTVRIYVR